MSFRRRPLLFALFFISGFSGLVYQVVWTRLAFASFGIITPVLSVVISVFMLGLSLGSWLGGKAISGLAKKAGISAIAFYALAEFVIGLGAFAVPKLFAVGEHILLASGQSDSSSYLIFSALTLAISILPWCVFMGATFPLMMSYLREREPQTTESFSYLYLANVLGAVFGTLTSALVLIELLGFQRTLWVAAVGNFTVTVVSAWLAREAQKAGLARNVTESAAKGDDAVANIPEPKRGSLIRWVLFATGFCSMAMEVVWTRAFTPVLKTQVYSFALVLATYLAATFVGSIVYRRHLRKKSVASIAALLGLLSASAFLPIIFNDIRLVKADWLYIADPKSVALLLTSIVPFCALLGYLTPGLIDEYAAGSPARAGRAYAINVLGCILGPLFACYLLLPKMSEQLALLLLALPFVVLFIMSWGGWSLQRRANYGLAMVIAAAVAMFFSRSYEEQVLKKEKNAQVRQDYAASVYSYGDGFTRLLCVNGLGMTTLTPITKFMVHLPLALHQGEPKSALVICFGMGTSYRSALSWDIETTAVELVPSVVNAFPFYHTDAEQCLKNPKGRVVIDDGHRFLKRTQETYDVIIVDPPPPMEAAGSSLLYSKEFFELARQKLKPNGILQAWYPGGDLEAGRAIVRSLYEVFPHVRCFDSVERYGVHLFASVEPIPDLKGGAVAARMPEKAQKDILEWSADKNLPAYLDKVLKSEYPIDAILSPDLRLRITDDRPFNEYFLLRRLRRL